MPSSRRRRHRRNDPDGLLRAGRVLIAINVAVLLASAFTEYFWTWDGFRHGGQDLELSLLALLAFLCLMVIFAHYFRRRVSDLLDRSASSCVAEDFITDLLYAAPSLLSRSAERPPGLSRRPHLSSVILRI